MGVKSGHFLTQRDSTPRIKTTPFETSGKRRPNLSVESRESKPNRNQRAWNDRQSSSSPPSRLPLWFWIQFNLTLDFPHPGFLKIQAWDGDQVPLKWERKYVYAVEVTIERKHPYGWTDYWDVLVHLGLWRYLPPKNGGAEWWCPLYLGYSVCTIHNEEMATVRWTDNHFDDVSNPVTLFWLSFLRGWH